MSKCQDKCLKIYASTQMADTQRDSAITYRLPATLHRKLKVYATENEMELQQVMDMAVAALFGDLAETPPPAPPELRELQADLEYMHAHRTDDNTHRVLAQSIIHMLHLFREERKGGA